MTADEQRALGAELFNRTYALMEKATRTPDEDTEMLHCAHASAYHWAQVGTAANRSPRCPASSRWIRTIWSW